MHPTQFSWLPRQIRHLLLPVAGCVILFHAGAGSARAHPDLDVQIQIVSALIAEGPTAQLHLRRGELYRQHAEFERALQDLAVAEKLAPTLNAVRLCRAQTLVDARRFAAALPPIDQFLSVEEGNAKARLVRARVLAELHRPEEALRDYDAALRLAPDSGPEIYVERAAVCELLRRPADALATLERGMARIGEVPGLQMPALELELRLQRHADALRRIERMLATAERKESWHVRRAQCLAAMGRVEEARAAYSDARDALARLPSTLRATQAMRELEASIGTALTGMEDASPLGCPNDAK